MALTLVPQVDDKGKAGTKPVFSKAPRPLIITVVDADMDTTNYATGGEPFTAADAGLGTLLYVGIEQKDTNTAADRREFAYDYSAGTILFYDAFNTEETASDQGVVALRLFCVGY